MKLSLEINECHGNPCHHGTCTDGIASYSCSCYAGYTGNNCDRGCITCLIVSYKINHSSTWTCLRRPINTNIVK